MKRIGVGFLAALAGVAIQAAPVAFAPLYSGVYDVGAGASARFVKVNDSWKGSTVLWTEDGTALANPNKYGAGTMAVPGGYYGVGTPIGSFGWGTGIWGIADWQQAMGTGNGCAGVGAMVTSCWSGVAPVINYGNAVYNANWEAQWGKAQDFPLAGLDTNWAAEFTGFIRVSDAGAYNFSVLYDDGFFFELIGANGQSLRIDQDFLNPRDREGFDNDLDLGVGVYGFRLGAYNRLEAGVVDLRWREGDCTAGDACWEPVPTGNLLRRNQVPEPSGLALIGLALVGLAAASRRRGRRA